MKTANFRKNLVWKRSEVLESFVQAISEDIDKKTDFFKAVYGGLRDLALAELTRRDEQNCHY